MSQVHDDRGPLTSTQAAGKQPVLNGINAQAYLRYVLNTSPITPSNNPIQELLPWNVASQLHR